MTSETPPPADVITKDPTQPTSYRKVTQSAHTGYKAELYKVVYENDVEVSRTRVNKSNYAAAPRYVTIGTKVEEEKEKDTKKDKSKNKDTDDKKQDQNLDQNPDQTNEQTNQEAQSRSAETNNLANPDNQIQADIWDRSWDDGFEDE